MTHGPQVTPCQAVPALAPCGKVIRPATPTSAGDGTSASTRFIDCKRCLELGKRGKFQLIWGRLEQLRLKWQEELRL